VDDEGQSSSARPHPERAGKAPRRRRSVNVARRRSVARDRPVADPALLARAAIAVLYSPGRPRPHMDLRRAKPLAAPLLVLAVALAVRLEPWREVYASGRPMLVGDSDPHYHVLRAERWLSGAPGAPWRDPRLDWPAGADVPWPPLFDALVAATARAAGGPALERDAIASAAAPLPVALGLVFVALVAWLGRKILGRGRGWIAAFLVAALPSGALTQRLGRVDQHVLEQVLYAAILIATLGGRRSATRIGAAAALAVLVPVAFWSWMGSAVHLLVPLATVAAAWVVLPADDPRVRAATRALAAGTAAGAALLAATVLAFGRPGALLGVATTGVGGLQVAVVACSAAFLLLLLAAVRLRRGPAGRLRRVAEVAIAAVLPGAALLSSAALRGGIAGGLTALAAGNAWYAHISEFQPLLNLGNEPLGEEIVNAILGLGLAPLAAAIGLAALRAAWRAEPERRLELLLLLAAGALFVPAMLARKRFGAYAIVPIAIAAEAGIRGVAAAAAARWERWRTAAGLAAATAALSVACAAPTLPEHLAVEPVLSIDEEHALEWLASQPVRVGREAVVGPWSYGHLVQYYADRPVVSSPFGTEGGPRAMADEAQFWFAKDEADAEAVLSRRRAGYVLLTAVLPESTTMHGFAPPGTPPPVRLSRHLVRGLHTEDTEQFWKLVPIRLYYDDGAITPFAPAIGGFRLVYETPRRGPDGSPLETNWTVFEPVPGARLEVVAAPGAGVQTSVEFETNAGRRSAWRAEVRADASGRASLRLPYASGWNGAVFAREYEISDGRRTERLVVHEASVALGGALRVDLAAAPPPR
jgi:asparagine N-glycosylation enzyme membrane subunit Stt3